MNYSKDFWEKQFSFILLQLQVRGVGWKVVDLLYFNTFLTP